MKYFAVVLAVVGCAETVDATRGSGLARSDAAATGGAAATRGGGTGGDRDAVPREGSGGSVHGEGGPCAPLEGGTGTWSPAFSAHPGECKTCVVSMDAYCSLPSNCKSLSEHRCQKYASIVSEVIQRGCGYVKFSYYGDVGDAWGDAYDEATGKLVYTWSNGKETYGCRDAVVVGVEPKCTTWTTLKCVDGGIPN